MMNRAGLIGKMIPLADRSGERVFDIQLFAPEQRHDLQEAVQRKTPEALTLRNIITGTIERIRTADPPVICACCPATIRGLDGITFGTILPPIQGAPKDGIGFLICPECDVRSVGDPRLIAAIREYYSPGARLLTVTHPEGGRA